MKVSLWSVIILCVLALITISSVLLGSLIVWGIVSFILWAFQIDFQFTYWMAIGTYLLKVLIDWMFFKNEE